MKKKTLFMVILALFIRVMFGSAEDIVITEDAVWAQLNEVKDQQFVTLWSLMHSNSEALSVVDMGLIYNVNVENNNVYILMTVYNQGFQNVQRIASPVRKKILAMPGVGTVTVECIWPPLWIPDRLNAKARKVLRYETGDPVEGVLHVRSTIKSAPDEKPYAERKLDRSHLVIPDTVWGEVDTLPGNRLSNWRDWHYFKRFEVEEKDGLARQGEPIFADAAFEGSQVNDLAKEIRIIEETTEQEIPCQIYGQVEEGNVKRCTVVFLSTMAANEKKGYLLMYGNSSPDLQAPAYTTDLVTTGEGYALDIENSYYTVHLSPTSGHLKNLRFKNGGKTFLDYSDCPIPPQTIFDASNDPGTSMLDLIWHGEDYCIHWGPDFSDQLRFRMTMWWEAPNYSIVRGPICTIVKRWGYPITVIYPAFPQTSGMLEVTYTFYSGLPYFTMESRLTIEKEIDIRVVRNDQWTFKGVWTHEISMPDGGDIKVYQQNISFDQDPALMGCYNSVNGDGFVSLHLAFDALGFTKAYYKKASSLLGSSGWVRYAFDSRNINANMPIGIQPGATIGEYNAFLLYNNKDSGGNNQAKDWYNVLRRPLKKSLTDITTSVNEREENSSTAPATYSLSQNYPNPFNSGTEISFTLPRQGEVELCVYSLSGQKIATLAQGNYGAGVHTMRWDGRDDNGRELASGVFLYQMRAGMQVITQKLLLLR